MVFIACLVIFVSLLVHFAANSVEVFHVVPVRSDKVVKCVTDYIGPVVPKSNAELIKLLGEIPRCAETHNLVPSRSKSLHIYSIYY